MYMRKMKWFVTIFYVAFSAAIFGAWNHEPEVKEAAAFSELTDEERAEQENQEAREEAEARYECSVQMMETMNRSNAYYMEENFSGEERRDKQRKREQLRRKRIREKKRQERKILERIVEAEAGGQDLKGRILVANVILNRVKSKHFPNTVEKVVFAHRQFSPISNGSYYRVSVSEKTEKAVQKALNGVDYSNGALYFMCRKASDPANVRWFDRDLTKVKEYGCHEFFK